MFFLRLLNEATMAYTELADPGGDYKTHVINPQAGGMGRRLRSRIPPPNILGDGAVHDGVCHSQPYVRAWPEY
jgi:hypothetical protein